MEKKLYSSVLAGLMLVMLVHPAVAQSRWDGADNLPVNPLVCPGETAEDPEGAGTYDGRQPANPPDLADAPIVVVDVRQPFSADYDSAVLEGMLEAANQLGNVELISGSSSMVGVQQASVDQYMLSGVNGVLVAAAEEESISSNLRTALNAGIHVVAYDADVDSDAREWFVQPAAYNAVAKALIDNFVEQAGPDAGVAILTPAFDSPQAARWIAEMWAYADQCYPELEWLETLETQDESVLAYNQAAILFREYAGDLGGIISVATTATPNAAEAVTQAGVCDRVTLVGLATPNEMRPYIERGCVQSAVLWDPVDVGYAAVQVMRAVVDGDLQPGDSEVQVGRLGALPIVNGSEILLGQPLVFTAGNIRSFDF